MGDRKRGTPFPFNAFNPFLGDWSYGTLPMTSTTPRDTHMHPHSACMGEHTENALAHTGVCTVHTHLLWGCVDMGCTPGGLCACLGCSIPLPTMHLWPYPTSCNFLEGTM